VNVFSALNTILAVVNAGIQRVAAFIRNRSNKSKTVQDGFHVNRAGKVIYPRGYRSYLRKLSKYGRSQTMRLGGPVLTGKRLERTAKSCCPANLLVQPRHRVTVESVLGSGEITKTQNNACTCGQHPAVMPRSAGVLSIQDYKSGEFVPVGRVISIDEVFAKALQPVGPA
jgi:hypothetical protein